MLAIGPDPDSALYVDDDYQELTESFFSRTEVVSPNGQYSLGCPAGNHAGRALCNRGMNRSQLPDHWGQC